MRARFGAVFLLAGTLGLLPRQVASQQPWLTGEVQAERDNQVRTTFSTTVEHGRYLGGTVTLAARVTASSVEADGLLGDLRQRSVDARLAGTLSLPAARLGLQGSVGALLDLSGGSSAHDPTPVYGVAAGYNAGFGTTLRAAISRGRYTSTAASLDTLLMHTSWELSIDRSSAPGWAGKAAFGRLEFGDGNPVSTGYAWVLAPISRAMRHSLRLGYAGSWQDAAESNWVPAGPSPNGPAPQPVPGRYAPYYTPHDAIAHSALLNVAIGFGGAWLLTDASIGFHATEIAPTLIRTAPQPQSAPGLFFYERSFTPFRIGASLVTPLDASTSMTVAGEFSRSAYYRTGSIRLMVARSL